MRDDTIQPNDLGPTDRVRFTGAVIGEPPPLIDLGWRDRDGRHVILEHTGSGWYRPRPVEHHTPAAPTTVPPPPHQRPAAPLAPQGARPRQRRRRPMVALKAGDDGSGEDPDAGPPPPSPDRARVVP
jgi:hypothetical protein